MKERIGQLLGIEDLQSIESVSLSFAAPWAEQRPALVLFAVLGAAAAGWFFYARWQPVRGLRGAFLGTLRAVLLALVALILAEPYLALSLAQRPRPLLVWLFDGSDSMNLVDRLSPEAVKGLAQVLPAEQARGDRVAQSSRLQLLGEALKHKGPELFKSLERCRVRSYLVDRLDQVRELETYANLREESTADAGKLAGQLEAQGQVTALGAALADIRRRHRTHLLAGVVIASDFDQNAGPPAIAAARELGAPVYAVGLGPSEAVDLAVDLQTPPALKKDEQVAVTAFIQQTGLTGRSARVTLMKRSLSGVGEGAQAMTPAAPPQVVVLDAPRVAVSFPYLPEQAGRFMLQARVEPFEDEALSENNAAEREVNVRDDALKLLFVEHEPTWEWRFVKEVFHRDPLVGREGFRTFLHAADFKVRRSNELFVETLVRTRGEFFAYDVIFLSDLPSEMLPDPFQQMLREYVEQFGGGLVVLAGPRFGPSALAGGRIADMLPVVLDPSARAKPGTFRLQLTPQAREQDFMILGKDEDENRLAWNNLGPLAWYHPVMRPHPLATVLASHPQDRCVDDQTPQPLIATRRVGRGEVVYLGFNETWRLRRIYGEKYYRQFWGQLIYRLGLGRALGSQKRFQVFTDRAQYQAGDKVRLTVEAYDAGFNPLRTDHLTARLSSAEGGGRAASSEFQVPLSRDGVVFEATVPVYAAGSHHILVRDPVTQQETPVHFRVAPVTVERRGAVRDYALQQALAAQTGGKAYELHELTRLGKDLSGIEPVKEITERRLALWNTWAVLLTGLGLMLVEWLSRKLASLR